MKIAHTSDWHIGKKLMGRDRGEEFKAVLAEIGKICRGNGVELLLVAGDVFDTYTPSAEAEEIFYTSVKEIARTCAVLIISGNHDDYIRLTAAGSIAEELNIYIIGNNLAPVTCKKRGTCYPVESAGGYIVFENEKGERVYINALPYPNEARFKEEKSDESFADKIKRWIDIGQQGNTDKKYPEIFLSHIFAAGGSASDSEREIDLGGARVVGLNLFPDCDYAALGHLHKRQKLGENIYYSGAIMRFTFDEAGSKKSINLFDITEKGIENFRQEEITQAKPLVRLQANSASDGAKLLGEYKNAYAELTLNLSAPLTPTELTLLKDNENLLSLKMAVQDNIGHDYGISNAEKSASQLFTDYYVSQYGEKPSDKLLGLFLSLTEEE
ncbi:MAG: exonuclease subunit SbcD [Clostridia bacterium]|nr:exonuclease subunit SbcD [Clostridia bacterium]